MDKRINELNNITKKFKNLKEYWGVEVTNELLKLAEEKDLEIKNTKSKNT
jgi:hypothetical protein